MDSPNNRDDLYDEEPVVPQVAPRLDSHTASWHHSSSELRRMLDAGASVHTPNPLGRPPLMQLMIDRRTTAPFEVVQLLIEAGADVHVRDECGISPIFYSNPQVARLFLEAGACYPRCRWCVCTYAFGPLPYALMFQCGVSPYKCPPDRLSCPMRPFRGIVRGLHTLCANVIREHRIPVDELPPHIQEDLRALKF